MRGVSEFKMSATGEANKSAFSLSTQEGIPSGPDALFVLSADSFLMTENSDIGRGGSCWCAYACVCTSGVARGLNALIGDKKASSITLAKCLGSSPSSARCCRSAMGLVRSTLEKPLGCLISFHHLAGLQALRSLTLAS